MKLFNKLNYYTLYYIIINYDRTVLSKNKLSYLISSLIST